MARAWRRQTWWVGLIAIGAVLVSSPSGASGGVGIIGTTAGGPGLGRATDVPDWPIAVGSGPGGMVYVGDQSRSVIRSLQAGSNIETVVSGDGTFGYAGDGGPATSAEMTGPVAVAGDRSGNVAVADFDNDRVRWVASATGTFYGLLMTAGDIYTVAGDGSLGFSGDGGPATNAQISGPLGVSLDQSDNLVIADTGNNRVRVVAASNGTLYGQPMSTGNIYTIAGGGSSGLGDGGPAASAGLVHPRGVAVDGSGNVVIVDSDDNRVRVVANSTGTFYGRPMTAGDIYTIAGDGSGGFRGDGGPATRAALRFPKAIALDASGNVAIDDRFNSRVRVVATTTGMFYGRAMTAGDIYTVAGGGTSGLGDGGPATNAELLRPRGVTVDRSGNLVIADTGNKRVRVLATSTGTFYGRPMAANDIYTVAGNGTAGHRGGYSGDGGAATGAELFYPSEVALDRSENLVVADTHNGRVRVVALSTGTFYGQAMTGGDIYTVAGNGSSSYAGDGGPATAAGLSRPRGAAIDRAGNLVIADSGNNRVRVVATSNGSFYGQAMTGGDIYTVAGNGTGGSGGDGGPATEAELNSPNGVGLDGSGNVVIADTASNRIRVVAVFTGSFYGRHMTAGDIYTVAGTGTPGFKGDGGPASRAELSNPEKAEVDGSGNVLIGDTANNRIRLVAVLTGSFYGEHMTAGDIYTVAGNGTRGFSGDGGPATSAGLNQPCGVAVDGSGDLLIADSLNSRVRMVAATTGMHYGQPMTGGDIYTVAGGGAAGLGDRGPATSALLYQPCGVVVDGSGNLDIADTLNSRIRQVSGP